jgi:hypothetical protein
MAESGPGKREHVCPSSPIPRRIRSNTGKRTESFEANEAMSFDSYSSARVSRSSSDGFVKSIASKSKSGSSGLIVLMCFSGIETPSLS